MPDINFDLLTLLFFHVQIRAVLDRNLSDLTQTGLDDVVNGLELLLHAKGAYSVKVIRLFAEIDSGRDRNCSM